jgi:pilus assembly protein Flp/PilA
MPQTIRCFVRNEQGATAIEYALIAAGIAVAVAATVMSLGDAVRAMYERISAAVAAA